MMCRCRYFIVYEWPAAAKRLKRASWLGESATGRRSRGRLNRCERVMVNMTKAQLLKAKLDTANLANAVLVAADRRGATLRGVAAPGAIWNRAVCPNGTGRHDRVLMPSGRLRDRTGPSAVRQGFASDDSDTTRFHAGVHSVDLPQFWGRFSAASPGDDHRTPERKPLGSDVSQACRAVCVEERVERNAPVEVGNASVKEPGRLCPVR